MSIINGLDPGKSWVVTIEEFKPRRSISQNNFLFGVVYPAIIEQAGNALTGFTAEDLHELFLGDHYGWQTIEGFGRKRMRPVKRSSKLSKQEFSDHLLYIESRVAELGITIPEPNDFIKNETM